MLDRDAREWIASVSGTSLNTRTECCYEMLITTTPGIEGKRIRAYKGIVTGEAILGANIFRDLFAGLRDIVGGRAAAYEKELRKARETAMAEMQESAQALGADAIVGVDLDYEVLGTDNGMLMVSVSGTAVALE